LTKSESLAAVQLPEDLNSSRLRFAALKGSTSEAFVRNSLPQAKRVLVERGEDGIQKVLAAEVDGMIADKETAHFAILRHPDAQLHMSANTFTVEPMGIAVPQDQPHLANLLQSYLTALANKGTLERVRQFWFKDPSWVKDLR
jgi:polar amino acid transport system substrate-binding protein